VERALTLPADSTPTTAAADRAARLGDLFDRQQARLYRLALRMGAEPGEAADLVQDAFLRLARSSAPIPEGEGGEAWLVRALVNLCRDRHRRRAVRARAAHWVNVPPARSPDPESAASARERVGDALSRLSPRRRAVVVLHEIEGHALVEVARMLGIASVTARWHLSAGRRDLRRLLVDDSGRRT
jgi:RNA polymerase sigma-70 factor (ECF subfamily)